MEQRWNTLPPDDRQAIWDSYNKTQGTGGAAVAGGIQTGEVNLNNMSQQQQYDYFQSLVE